MNYRMVSAVLVLACFVCVGCGKRSGEAIAEKLIEKSMEQDGVKADVSISDEKVTVKAGDKSMSMEFGESVAIPEKFPKDVPIYKGAKVTAAMSLPEGFNVGMQSKDALAKIVSFYKEKLAAEGWTEKGTFATPDQTLISSEKGKMTLAVSVTTADGQSAINMTVLINTDAN